MQDWTIEDAEAALPRVRALLAEARAADADLREAVAQLADLRTLYGTAVEQPGHEEHDDWKLWRGRYDAFHARLQNAVQAFRLEGIELKDVALGLVDFPARMADEKVWLCWRDGEEHVAWWHGLDAGFAGRKPVPDVASE